MSVISDKKLEELRNMELGELRAYAKQYHNMSVGARSSAENIIAEIIARTESIGATFVDKGDDDAPKSGWARIILQPDASPGGDKPLFCSVNTYTARIPRGVEVDVPIKVLKMLQTCVRHVIKEDETKGFDDPGRRVTTKQARHNIQVVQISKGEDPRGSWEKQRERKLAPYRKFYEEMGFYPNARQLKEHIQSGQFKLHAA